MESLQMLDKHDNDLGIQNLKGKVVVSNIFVLLGIGTLLPWNAFISAEPYFDSRLCTSSNFMLWFGFIYNGMGVITLGIMILRKLFKGGNDNSRNDEQGMEKININQLGHNENVFTTTRRDIIEVVPFSGNRECDERGVLLYPSDDESKARVTDEKSSDNSNQRKMVVLPLSVFLAIFIFTSGLVFIRSISPTVFLSLTLICIAVCGSMSSIVGAGIIFVSSIFPSQVGVNSYLSGQSVGGVIISSINLFTATMDPPKDYRSSHCNNAHEHKTHNNTGRSEYDSLPLQTAIKLGDDDGPTCSTYQTDWGAFAYFGICCVILGLCIISYFILERLPFTQYYKKKVDNNKDNHDLAHLDEQLIDMDPLPMNHDGNSSSQGDECSKHLCELSQNLVQLPNETQQSLPHIGTKETTNITSAVWKLINYPAIAIFLTFTVTLAIFPSWIVKIQSVHKCQSHSRILEDLFIPMSILIFNIGDLIGRVLTRFVNIHQYENFSSKLVMLAVGRTIFLPLFLLCHVPGKFIEFSINSDFYFYFLLLIFSVSNGMVATLSFMHAPQLLPSNEEMQEVSSTILTFAVAFGLLCGSSCSFLYNLVGTGKWT